jgi:small-conductance mechanosensitive channel
MESIPTKSTPPRPRFLRAVVAALLMSVITLLIWFLTSENVSTIGLAILITAVILALLNWLIWTLTRNAKRGGKSALRIVAAIASLIILLSATIYTFAPTQLFYPHSDEESTQALAAYPNAEQLTIKADGRVVSGWMIHQAEGKSAARALFRRKWRNRGKTCAPPDRERGIDAFSAATSLIWTIRVTGFPAATPTKPLSSRWG